MTTSELRDSIAKLPRVRLAHLPTPLEPLPRLSAALGDVALWIKRDDCTGLAMGGNKTRQLEFTMGEALAEGADCIVQGAGAQSNHCRQAAAAAARLGMECHLILHRESEADLDNGNVLLDRILGARLHFTEAELGPALEAEKRALGDRLRGEGRRPYVIGEPRAKTLGAAAYALQVAELVEQCAEQGLAPGYVYACTAGPTHAGLLLGKRALGQDWTLQSVAPIRWPYDVPPVIAGTANRLAEELCLETRISPDEVRHTEDYVGTAYGVLTREAQVAIELVARTEGILLDPYYTGKAMAGLIDHVRKGIVRPGAAVVFIHTGGLPALFGGASRNF